ncbi:hypothetical protein WN944_024390 [Citrus x changshan-huyou]|uniref:Uncharacterized protein n=1 Tax=Citrus x changshan-huyou TaxID=2935761 RepID=A0AAP0LMX2_9ROSI
MPSPGPPYPGQDFLQMLAAITSQYLLSHNNFSGGTPSSIFTMHALLDFSDNQLFGEIPYGIGYLPNLLFLGPVLNNLTVHFLILRFFNLGFNRFSGTIPSSITNASKLSGVDTVSNSFSGFIPDTVGNPLDGILPNLVGILSLYLETIYIAKGSVISQDHSQASSDF